ncbi:hypothetical protein TrST_g7785 [Triparma strigata]|uniref:Uncharacterized protein n=1 Tax=Triparma strigata TaxID=1606541 RepID=A0A9W7AXM7_9STRA|nr:hypothetical protein TrST_g7785 [Triparma strigata]
MAKVEDLPVDQLIAAIDLPQRYIPLPDETTFVEACCHSDVFRPKSVFVPVTAGAASGLFEIELASGQLTKRCALPGDGQYFGAKIGHDGECYMLFVGNDPLKQTGKVYSCDLTADAPTAGMIVELPLPYQPNDIAIDRSGGRLLIAAYEQTYNLLTTRGQVLNTLMIAAKRSSKIFMAPTSGGAPDVFASGFNALAGAVVCESDNSLWLSELHNLARVPLNDPKNWERVSPFNPELLADNMEVEGDEVLFPFYRRCVGAKTMTNIMACQPLVGCLFGLAKCLWKPPAKVGSVDAVGEAAPAEAPADEFEDVCWGRYNVKTGAFSAMRVDITNTKFDGHCTHLEKVGTELIFVNYLKKEILVVDIAGQADVQAGGK